MIAEPETNEQLSEALAGGQKDWSALVSLARRVIHSASLAVMVHAELDRCAQQQVVDKDV